MLERIASGGVADAFAVIATRFLKQKLGELDPDRIACMNYVASAPRHPDWPYVPPDHELFFDVITHDGAGYLFRYGDDGVPSSTGSDDDPLFAAIQPPIPITKVDLSMCGAMLFVGVLREVVILSNIPFDPTFIEQVGRHNNIVANLGGPAGRAMRLITFPWDPANPEAWQRAERSDPTSAASEPGASPTRPESPSRPESPALAAMHRGNRLAEQRRFEEALRCQEEALALDPKLALAWSNKAYALSGLRLIPESRAAAEQALKIDPKLVPAWINLSNALLSLGHYADAIQVCQRGLEIDPKAPALHYNLATAADKTYKQPLAVKHFLAFVEHATPAMHAEVARVHQRLRMYRH